MAFKAQLSVVLKADDVVVAETYDNHLWVKILATLSEDTRAEASQQKHDQHGGHSNPVAA